ncbi:PREDICTED: neural proliferation differentiation and control protein 1-like [Cyprinodon variegatus]|uniref:neural proliferation differentiation and control protein 1-like n=1 Tax=Cyprinodon variegatus TaxID=28743 RepID=UPI000742532C|nr:PREDICTED: neural proliferation differentiation and control protein 1-like [Cyprinodon variegatus]
MRSPLLGRAAVFAALLVLSSCLTGSHRCPGSLDCARAGRQFCRPGGSRCGACLHPLVENSDGRCVSRRSRAHHSAPHSAPHSSEPANDRFPGGHHQRAKDRVQDARYLNEAFPGFSLLLHILDAVIVPSLPSFVSAPLSQDLKLIQPSSAHRGSPTEEPTSPSITLNTTTPPSTTSHTPGQLRDPLIVASPSNDHIYIIMSSVFIAAGSLALVIAGVCWVRLQKGVRLTQKVDYPAYGVMKAQTFGNFPGDKKLAQSAQMYHYQHQKQQMLSLEKSRDEPRIPDSGASTDEENEDGDFTVYECPGLAPTGEMEVKNPLFDDSNLYLQRFHK